MTNQPAEDIHMRFAYPLPKAIAMEGPSFYPSAMAGLLDALDEKEIDKLTDQELEFFNKQLELAIDAPGPINEKVYYRPQLLKAQNRVIDQLRLRIYKRETDKILSATRAEGSAVDLTQQISLLVDANNELQQKASEIEQERREAQKYLDEKRAEIEASKEQREAFKERWAIWKSFLEKESVSTILGAFLLLIIVICLIVTTFTKVTTPQILNDGFLVLLGYFFGQTTANAARKDKGD